MINRFRNFGELLIFLTNAKDISQAQLTSGYGLPKSTISTLLKSGETGEQKCVKSKTVALICIALKLSAEDTIKVIEFAHPEYRFLLQILAKDMSPIEANMLLYDLGLPLLM